MMIINIYFILPLILRILFSSFTELFIFWDKFTIEFSTELFPLPLLLELSIFGKTKFYNYLE